jgi:hypothetical protein
MSISDDIRHRIAENRLIDLAPGLPSIPRARRLLISQGIAAMVFGPWDNDEWEERCGKLRADFDRFISGDRLPVAADRMNDRKGTSYLKRLEPGDKEIWEIRSRDPKPALRVFGRFAECDVFVALTCEKRADLGDGMTRQWRHAQVECATEWRNLFPAYEPVHSNNPIRYDDYVTNYFVV